MASHKAGRMSEDIKRIISGMIRELKDPRIAGGYMLTVVRCDVARDGSFCRVYISSFEGLDRAKEVYKSQADVIEEYKAIDLEGIANGVSSIMRRLRSSTESLDNFTQYLNTVHDYYEEIQVFAEKLDKEAS